MTTKRITLEVAAFLDSSQAKALDVVEPLQVRKIVESFLSVCYDELGTEPRQLDGNGLHHALAHLLPARMAHRDPLAEHVPAVLDAYFQHLREVVVVSHAFEVEMSLEAALSEFLEAVHTGERVHPGPPRTRQKPVVHKAQKLGRNDPCSCGSGKKYKKCHGKGV